MKPKLLKIVAALAVSIATTATADVVYDDVTDEGFIGRGDVVGNPDLGKDKLVAEPAIQWVTEKTYSATYVTGSGQTRQTIEVISDTKTLSTSIISFSTRTAGGKRETQITGYVLDGKDKPISSGNVTFAASFVEDGVTWTRQGSANGKLESQEKFILFEDVRLDLTPLQEPEEEG